VSFLKFFLYFTGCSILLGIGIGFIWMFLYGIAKGMSK
jgi:hypothetical protein